MNLPNYIKDGGSALVNVPIGKKITIACIAYGIANVFIVNANGSKTPMPINPNCLPNQSVTCDSTMFGTGGTTVYIESVGGVVEWAVGNPPVLLSNILLPARISSGDNTFIQPNDSGSALGMQIVTPGATLAYAPGDTLTVVGGTAVIAAQLKVLQTTALSATIVAGGSGGTNGAVQLAGTTGTGQEKFILNGTITGGILTAIGSIYRPGKYTTNPTNPLIEPVTGGSLVGCTVNVVLGVSSAQVSNQGLYTTLPANPVTVTGGAGGTGFTANLTFLPPIPKTTMKLSPTATVFATTDIVGGVSVPFTDPRIYAADSAAWTLFATNTYGTLYQPRSTIGVSAARCAAVGVLHDGVMLELLCRGNDTWQFFVDQMDGKGFRLYNPYCVAIPTGSGDKPAFLKLDFGYRSLRKIICIGETGGIGGFWIEPTATLAPYDFTTIGPVTWGLIANSYGQKLSDAFPSGPHNEVISRLGGYMIYKDCEGGSGYASGTNPYGKRLSPLIDANPNNVLIDSPINDTTGAVYNLAIAQFYATLFSGLPNTNFQIWGCVTPASQILGVGLADCQSRSAAILDVLKRYPNTSWVFLDFSNGVWTKSNGRNGIFCNTTGIFTGTGHITATVGDGNSDVYIGPGDGTHPAPIGCSYLGRMAAVGYASAMNAG